MRDVRDFQSEMKTITSIYSTEDDKPVDNNPLKTIGGGWDEESKRKLICSRLQAGYTVEQVREFHGLNRTHLGDVPTELYQQWLDLLDECNKQYLEGQVN